MPDRCRILQHRPYEPMVQDQQSIMTEGKLPGTVEYKEVLASPTQYVVNVRRPRHLVIEMNSKEFALCDDGQWRIIEM